MRTLIVAVALVHLVSSPVVAQDITDWSGAYAGLGYGQTVGGTLQYPDDPFSADLRSEGGAAAFAGYNWQNGTWVYGAELAINDTLSGPEGYPDEFDEQLIDLKGRVGYAFARGLAYGFVSYSSGTYDHNSDSWTISGLGYGLGFDYMVSGKVFVGVEAAVRDLESPRDSSIPGDFSTYDPATVSLRVGYKF